MFGNLCTPQSFADLQYLSFIYFYELQYSSLVSMQNITISHYPYITYIHIVHIIIFIY